MRQLPPFLFGKLSEERESSQSGAALEGRFLAGARAMADLKELQELLDAPMARVLGCSGAGLVTLG